jgi:hypothetical protein
VLGLPSTTIRITLVPVISPVWITLVFDAQNHCWLCWIEDTRTGQSRAKLTITTSLIHIIIKWVIILHWNCRNSRDTSEVREKMADIGSRVIWITLVGRPQWSIYVQKWIKSVELYICKTIKETPAMDFNSLGHKHLCMALSRVLLARFWGHLTRLSCQISLICLRITLDLNEDYPRPQWGLPSSPSFHRFGLPSSFAAHKHYVFVKFKTQSPLKVRHDWTVQLHSCMW